MNKIQKYLYSFVIGIGFMSLSFFSEIVSGSFKDLINFVNSFLFYIGYGMAVTFGILAVIKLFEDPVENKQ
ncbi:hypothetical protein KUV80_09975 [Fictibacillus nanhaiensis]|uniref:hypothetical protein n=1 Tax=Fictibacillus nanhaiensis TaxID=742169 RepID=UPI001C98518E|nr:hypothetical protein [Fictibacillus nanhaiensis]MBY6036984.1 hypothetical protein [Fictibacillus nanhaiensis]